MSHERRQRGKAEKHHETQGCRGQVYGRGVRVSWLRGIVAPFIETVEAVQRSKRDDNQPGIRVRTIETRQERNGRCIRVVQVKISRPAARLSLHGDINLVVGFGHQSQSGSLATSASSLAGLFLRRTVIQCTAPGCSLYSF